jgi:hypothetical protein
MYITQTKGPQMQFCINSVIYIYIPHHCDFPRTRTFMVYFRRL